MNLFAGWNVKVLYQDDGERLRQRDPFARALWFDYTADLAAGAIIFSLAELPRGGRRLEQAVLGFSHESSKCR